MGYPFLGRILYIPVPQTVHVPLAAGLPGLISTFWTSFISRFSLHFTQYPIIFSSIYVHDTTIINIFQTTTRWNIFPYYGKCHPKVTSSVHLHNTEALSKYSINFKLILPTVNNKPVDNFSLYFLGFCLIRTLRKQKIGVSSCIYCRIWELPIGVTAKPFPVFNV